MNTDEDDRRERWLDRRRLRLTNFEVNQARYESEEEAAEAATEEQGEAKRSTHNNPTQVTHDNH